MSNGSEHERADYKALIEELHNLREPFSYNPSLGRRAASTIKALVAENDRLLAKYDEDTDELLRRRVPRGRFEAVRAERDALRAEVHAHLNDPDFDQHHKAVHAERDALRAQLDSMTTETRNVCICQRDDERKHVFPHLRVNERRLVGAWVEVPESEGQKSHD